MALAENEPEFFPQLVAELLALEVDLIVASGERAALAAKAATSRVPIIFAQEPDPVGSGLVLSLARPGGNATGSSFVAADLAGKQMQLLHEALPAARRVAMMWDVSLKSTTGEVQASAAAAARLGLRLDLHGIRDTAQMSRDLQAMAGRRPDALLVLADLRMIAYRDILIDWANRYRVPTVAGWTDFVRAGGMLSYAPSYEALFQRAAQYVHKVLEGAKPGDLPIEQPTRFELVLNLKTAKALGITMPQSLRLLADEVIE